MSYFLTLSVQFSSVTQSCPTLCDPMNHSMPGLPVHHQLLESTQTHVHGVSDAIQLSHPLSSPSPPAPNPSQHQGGEIQLMTMQYLCMLIGQFYFKYRQSKFIEKLIRFVVSRIKNWIEGEFNEGSQKVQTTSYRINKNQ